MAAPDYTEWIGRGRAHQAEGRPIDAMLCFRQASRADAAQPDSYFHLGEVLWQLGLSAEAISAWHEATRRAARFLAPVQALAEALLATGDANGAREAADRVQTLAPGDHRAELIAGIAAMMLEDEGRTVAAATRVSEALARNPGLTAIATLAGPLALACERVGDAAATAGLLDRLVRIAASPTLAATMPAQLLALACERAAAEEAPTRDVELRATLFAAACARSYLRLEHEALRRIAYAATRAAPDAAPALAQSYAQLCVRESAGAFPLLWPQRTAGDRLRVVALVAAAPASEAGVALDILSGLPRDEFDVTIAFLGKEAAPGSPMGVGVPGRLPAIALPAIPDVNGAKRVAALDPDLIIDLAGLGAAAGPLLAQRPARAIATLADLGAANVAPLVDNAETPACGIRHWLDELRHALPAPGAVPNAAAMASAWEGAVRAHQQGDLAAAREGYGRVLALQPGHAPAHYLLGIAMRDGGDRDGARAQFAAAVAAAPGFVDARAALAKSEQALGRPRFAVAVCAEGLPLTADPLPLRRALGLARLAVRDGPGAAEAFASALALDPADGETHYNHGVALQMQHKTVDAARAYQLALALQPDLTAASFNLGVLFQEQGATTAAIAAYENVLAREPENAAAYKNLGEVLQAAGRTEPWLANFDRFEACCPKALALAVQALEVLQHRGDFGRLQRYLDSLRRGQFHAETLLPMDGCVYPYRHVPPAVEHPFHRAKLGIPDDAIVIGAFVAGLKLSRRCLALWHEVLARIPRAKLAFSPVAPALRSAYVRIAAAAEIAKEQVLFVPQGRDDEENQARYELVDFVLDPMPYGGVNGTLEALDMGVPVVTLVGKRHAERSSYSILTNLGVTATIAQTGPEYVGIAVRLAEDAAFMREVRAAIRAGLARSPLTDRVAHTKALERAYLAALAARAPDALTAAASGV